MEKRICRGHYTVPAGDGDRIEIACNTCDEVVAASHTFERCGRDMSEELALDCATCNGAGCGDCGNSGVESEAVAHGVRRKRDPAADGEAGARADVRAAREDATRDDVLSEVIARGVRGLDPSLCDSAERVALERLAAEGWIERDREGYFVARKKKG